MVWECKYRIQNEKVEKKVEKKVEREVKLKNGER